MRKIFILKVFIILDKENFRIMTKHKNAKIKTKTTILCNLINNSINSKKYQP